MNASITYTSADSPAENVAVINLPLSKSLSNRLLIINVLSGVDTPINHVAKCDDTEAMLSALKAGRRATVNIGAAGTAMRFLTAYYASLPGSDIVLDGSERMRQRPIGILVSALRQLGADITYLGNDGYPPLHIKGQQLDGGAVEIDAGTSSQYISALLMVAPAMTLGMELTLKGSLVSKPYIDMTIAMMERHGINVTQRQSATSLEIDVAPGTYVSPSSNGGRVEADWSAASYWYEIAAFTGRTFKLKGLKRESLQGDSMVAGMFEPLGVKTIYNPDNSVTIKSGKCDTCRYEADMKLCPDLAQTVAATCCGLGIAFRLTGLSTLPIKETDRLEALRCELHKLGFPLKVNDACKLEWDGTIIPAHDSPEIETYNDHRMAMSIAPLAYSCPILTIKQPEVVSKSYPEFWQHLSMAGYIIKES